MLGLFFTVAIVITIVLVIVWNRRGLRRRGGRLGGRRGRLGGGLGARAAVSLAVLLEGLPFLHGVTTIIEELGVVFVLTTDGKVTGVVVVI